MELKQQLRQSIEGLDRGIFGVQVRAVCVRQAAGLLVCM